MEEIKLQEFDFNNIPMSCSWLIIGAPGSGKTTLIENMCYDLKHRYPVARAFMGTPNAYMRFCNIFHPLFVSSEYNETEEYKHIARQKKCVLENNSSPGQYAINIIDDASDDTRIYKSKIFRGLFKLGSQHYNQLLMVGTQYCLDLSPDIRKSVSYVAIFSEHEREELKKIIYKFWRFSRYI